MTANGVSSGARVVSEDEARLEAKRLLSDPRLHVSERHKAFLKYIVDAAFEGRGDTIKAYSIAIDVFNRPPSFDPSSDPIVRIEATRLREALDEYYKQLGEEPGARLDIPRGRYVPVFIERELSACPVRADLDEEQASNEPDSVQRQFSIAEFLSVRRWRLVAATGVLLPMVLTSVYFVYHAAAPRALDTQKPFVTLSINAVPKDKEAGDDVLKDLTLSVARFGTVRLKADVGAKSGAEEAGPSAYDINLRFTETPASLSMWWQVSDASTERPFGQTKTVVRS